VSGRWTAEVESWMQEHALPAVFDAGGVAPVVGTSDGERLDAARFAAWVDGDWA
jgi:hypothetical protein